MREVPGTIIIARPGEHREGHAAQPVVDVHEIFHTGMEGRPGKVEMLAVVDEGGVVVALAVVLDEEIPAVILLVIPEVSHCRSLHAVRLRNLESIAICGRRVVDQLVLEHSPLVAVLELRTEEDPAVSRKLQLGGAGVLVLRSDDLDQVVVLARRAARAGHHDVEQQLALSRRLALRAIDPHGAMHAQEQLVGVEADVEANPVWVEPSPLAAFEPDSRVVKDLALVVDHRAADAVVAHHVDVGVQPGVVVRGHDQAEVAETGSGRPSVFDFIEGPGVRSGGRKECGRAEPVAGLDVKLHHLARALPGDLPGVVAFGIGSHGHAGERPAFDRVVEGERPDPVRVGGAHRNRGRCTGLRHRRRVDEPLIGRPDVCLGLRVGCPGRARRVGAIDQGGAWQAIEVEASVELV